MGTERKLEMVVVTYSIFETLRHYSDIFGLNGSHVVEKDGFMDS